MMYITEGTPSYMLEPVEIGWSAIHGQGIMASKPFNKGEMILKAVDRSVGAITYLGLFINHQSNANATLTAIEEGWWVIALKDIPRGEEVTVDYTLLPVFLSRKVEGFKEV